MKICGVRSKSDVDAVAAAAKRSGIQAALGLNFYPPSVRYLGPADAGTQQLSQHAQRIGLLRVGVFVNESFDAIQSVVDSVGLDAVQLHGDEPIELAQQLIVAGCRVVRAIKLPTDKEAGLTAGLIADRVSPWADLGCHPLLDADAGAAHGGSGKTLDWKIVAQWAAEHPRLKWTLAGGLNPDNLATAIKQSTATSVDTASGVESQRGIKSAELIDAFFDASGWPA